MTSCNITNKSANETVTNCSGLKKSAAVDKMRLTDSADTEQLLMLIQPIPLKKRNHSNYG